MIRSETRAYDGLARLVELFADTDLGPDAARTVAILSKEDDGVLIKKNHAVIRVSLF